MSDLGRGLILIGGVLILSGVVILLAGKIPGFGKLRVEDTGTAVKAKTASGGRHPVIDIYVGKDSEVWRLAASTPHYIDILVP